MEKELRIMEPMNVDERRVVRQEQWIEEHKRHLKEEKEFTRAYDRMVSRRRQLPWVKIEKQYIFENENGKVSFSDLFEGRNQLVVQHFMFGPDDREGCKGCSFTADHVDCARMHFEHNNLSFVAVSRGPVDKLLKYKKRMGWSFNWVSSYGSDFNYDFHVSLTKEEVAKGKAYYNFEMTDVNEAELPGTSVFYKDEKGDIFHTYSSYARGAELLIGAYNYLDITPLGRNEIGSGNNLTDWVQRHDEYKERDSGNNVSNDNGESEKHSFCS